MNFKAASLKKVSDTGTLVVGGVAGAAISRGVAGVLPGGIIGKVALAAAAAYGAASINGIGTGADLAKGALLGMALEQGGEVIIGALQPVVSPMLEGEASTLKDFGKRALGLAGTYDYPMVDYTHQAAPQPALGSPIAYKNRVPLGM